MVLHKEVYSFEERKETEISPLWQWFQVFLYFCYIIPCYVSSYCFGKVSLLTESSCLLVSNIRIHKVGSKTLKWNVHVSSLIPNYKCDLITFVPLTVMAFSCFFMFLFFVSGRGGAGNEAFKSSWRLVLPAVIFNFICFCLAIYVNVIYQTGVQLITSEFLLADEDFSAKDVLLDIPFYTKEFDVFQYLLITSYALYFFLLFCGLSFFLILVRCIYHVDFVLVQTKVFISQNTPEKHILAPIEIQSSESLLNKDENKRRKNLKVHFSPSTEQEDGGSKKNSILRKKSIEK